MKTVAEPSLDVEVPSFIIVFFTEIDFCFGFLMMKETGCDQLFYSALTVVLRIGNHFKPSYECTDQRPLPEKYIDSPPHHRHDKENFREVDTYISCGEGNIEQGEVDDMFSTRCL